MFFGPAAYSIGSSVSSAGDVDGDGLDDLIIGAAGGAGGKNSGEVFLITAAYLAKVDTIDGNTNGILNLINVAGTGGSYRFVGAEAGDRAGISVSSAGDVDGDRLDDLIIGAAKADGSGSNSGETYLIAAADLAAADTADGHTDGVIDLDNVASQNSSYQFVGVSAGDLSGASISSAGDVDGDGLDDLIIGAAKADGGGSNSGETYLIAAADLAATDTADGHTDGVINPSYGSLQNSSYVFNGASSGDLSGVSVSSAGDVDGDGLDDLIIGASHAYGGGMDSGKSYLIAASDFKSTDAADGNTDGVIDLDNVASQNSSYQLVGVNADDFSGASISSAGDIDGDGLDDLIIGAAKADGGGSNSGETYLIAAADLKNMDTADQSEDGVISLANVALQSSSYQLIGADTRDLAGTAVSSAGDVDGDGLDDLIIGASQAIGTCHNGAPGSSYLIAGADLASLDTADSIADGVIDLDNVASQNSSYQFIGAYDDCFSFSGSSVSSAGDVDGDRLDDLIIGAPRASGGYAYSYSGEAYLIMAVDLKNLDECGGNKSNDTKQDAIINLGYIGGEKCQ